jgi:hypothetical protein
VSANASNTQKDRPIVKTLVQDLSIPHLVPTSDEEMALWLNRGYAIADVSVITGFADSMGDIVRVVTLVRDDDLGVDEPVPYMLAVDVPDDDMPDDDGEGDTPADDTAELPAIDAVGDALPVLADDDADKALDDAPTGVPAVLAGIIDTLPVAKSIAEKGLAATKARMDAEIVQAAEDAFLKAMTRNAYVHRPLVAEHTPPNVITLSL